MNIVQITFFLIVSLVFSYLFAVATQNLQIEMHESLHKKIYKVYGVDSNISFTQSQYLLSSGLTTPSPDINRMSVVQFDSMFNKQILNEAVAYNTHWFLFSIVWVLWFIAFMLFYGFIAWKR